MLLIQKQAEDIESNLTSKLESVLQPKIPVDLPSNLQKIKTAIQEIKSTVKQQIDGIHQQIDATSKKSLKVHLGEKFNQQQDQTITLTGVRNPDDLSDSNVDNKAPENGDQ